MDADRPPSLDLDQDMRFQRRAWKIQRVGYVALVLVFIAAFLGAFGDGGPLSSATAQAGGLEVEYQRLVRYGAPHVLRLRVVSPRPEIAVALPQSYLGMMQLETVTPRPTVMRASGDRVWLVFAADGPGQTLEALLALRPETFGLIQGSIEQAEGPAIDIRQFSYP